MEKQLTVTKPEGKVAIDGNGNVFTYEFVIKRAPRSIEATHRHVTDVVEIDSYGLEIKVFSVRGESETLAFSADFEHLSVRTADVAHLVNKVCRMEVLPSFDMLSAAINDLRNQQKKAYEKDANKALRKRLGVVGYSPFKRPELEAKGLIASSVEEDDTL